MPNRLIARLAFLSSAMLIVPTMAAAALLNNAEVDAILDRHFITNLKGRGVADTPENTSDTRVVKVGAEVRFVREQGGAEATAGRLL